jgi:ABC-type amino acid transport substrate-binding protein
VIERRTLRVGFFADGVPFSFVNASGDLVGMDVEMGLSLAGSLGVTAEFIPIDRDELQQVLESGVCDIVMSGLVVTVETAARVEFSEAYHEERMSLLALDHRRAEFDSLSELRGRALDIGSPSERLVAPITQRLPQARVKRLQLARLLTEGEMEGVDAVMLPFDQAYYVSRVRPEFSAIVPDDDNTRAVVAYALPLGADSLRDVVNTWVRVTRANGGFSDAYDYWVRGRAQTDHRPRWSIGHDLMGIW